MGGGDLGVFLDILLIFEAAPVADSPFFHHGAVSTATEDLGDVISEATFGPESESSSEDLLCSESDS